MTLAEKLAQERRARLAAERLLELKQAELIEANRKLGKHALQLSHEITETRAEVAEVRDENQRVMVQLGEATEKIEIVEGQLWQALRTIRDGFAMFGADGRMELANPAYLAIFDGVESIGPGCSFGHVLDVLCSEGIVDLQGEAPMQWQARMLARWEADPIPNEILRLWNGRFVKVQDRRTPEGGVVTLGVDITGLMRMWSAVEELPDGFVIYDAEDRLLMCNDPYREIYAESADAMVPGRSFEDILRHGLERGQYADAIGREEEWLEERLELHRTASIEHEQELGDGRWLRVYERETRDGGRVGLRIDITQIKQDQQRLRDAMIRAEAANRAKSAFLANMSHEIRTPMNGVVGMADLMMDTGLSDDQRLYVDTIRSSGEALLVIINDILDYSKIEAEKLELHPEPFDLERSIHEVVMLLQPSARDKGIALLVDYDMFLPTRFVGDPGRVRQILTNLIGNAVKFTIEGHVLVRVVGVVDRDERVAVHLTVEDTGIGIPQDKIDHVFVEFNQVEDERDRKFEGTGLGLAITSRLVALMEGEIWVESEPGKGTCFGLRVVLPADEPIVFETAALPGWMKRALVVDDNGTNSVILSKQLAAVGLQAAFCKTAAEACDRMSEPPDLLITEQDLPDMTGQDLVAHLRRSGHETPAILLTDSPGSLRPGADGTVEAVLQRPAPRRALFAALEAMGRAGPPERNASPTPLHPRLPAMREDTDAEGAQPALESPGPEEAPPTLDVLVAEDNKTNQLVFRKMAAGFDLSLRFAGNGIEAVAAYRDRRPDLIFMDISMPQMDGKQATREIRALEDGGPHVPIVAVTAHAMTGDRESILEAGLDDYLKKPLRKAELVEKIELYRARCLRDKAG
jgi:signal transduction histidine kinase/CheY-like chemotaxis protein